MVRAILIFSAFVLLSACSAVPAVNAQPSKNNVLVPETFVGIQGPCYAPSTLQKNLDKMDFNLVATAKSVNGRGVDAIVLFFRSGDKFIVALRSIDRICVVITGEHLDFGV